MFVMVVTVIMSHACHMIIMDLPIGNVCSGCYCCVTCVSHDNFAGFSASSLGSTPSVPDSVGVTPLRGISLDSVMSLPESTPATPPGGVTGDTPVRKPLGKEARVSLRGTKRTKSDEIVIKAGGDTRQAKRSKSESLSALKKSTAPKMDKRSGRNLGSVQACVKDLGRWRATDDVLLISAVEQTNDLAAVHAGVKFSCKFTLKEIEARWQALLYDKHISKLAMQAVQALQPGVLVSESQSIPWSEEEESLLSTVPSVS
jgi:microspherule protein 1